MSIGESLAAEVEFEAGLTRKVLERVPDNNLDFKPHEKSFTMGALASHIADNLSWASAMIEMDQFDMDPEEFEGFNGKSSAEIVKHLDDALPATRKLLAECPDEKMFATWKMTIKGEPMIEMPRLMVIRGWLINHAIHHRGQLTVYLRMCDVPLPAIYGPSADEQG